MAEQKTKEELVRLAWVTQLRRDGHRQCRGGYWDDYESKTNACALGVLREAANMTDWSPGWVERATGLSAEQATRIVAFNDGCKGFRPHTFSEIADVVEGWFKP